ncbi:MAG: peptide chain release factor N(5)-glutamine methyltransferase [Campylobacterota bacterium]|nr:peptide chain release factor N(5)-glutamine methyltransferase [Campylobacterota bacterium]
MATYKQIIKEYSILLREITHIPQKEVEILILHIMKKNVIWLHLNYDKECECSSELKKLVQRRATDYPLEYITKRVSFYGESFYVSDGVLIPRPQTEILIEIAEKYLKDINSSNIIEIGTGSGIISIMLALLIPDIKITAVDINDKALELAQTNAKKHNVEDKITFMKSDLFENIKDNEKFDLCISNPPYIANDYKLPKNVKYEPANALFGGSIGDELLKNIILESNKREISVLMCEMGYDQKKPLGKFITENIEYKSLEFYKDLEKFDRGFILFNK